MTALVKAETPSRGYAIKAEKRGKEKKNPFCG
jgi:hypothetical protein